MSSYKNVAVKILGCFALCCALLDASAQARTLPRIHKQHHHHSADARNSPETERDEAASSQDNQGRHQWRHRNEDVGLNEATRRVLEEQERYLQELLVTSRRSANHAVRKRHDRGSGNALYVKMKDSHLDVFKKSPGYGARENLDPMDGEYYEVEVKEAQNSSLCNYTVEAIPDRSADQSRTPKHLVNVKCNNPGSSCPHVDTHCCIQTYSTIDTSYANGTYQPIKIYTGCVCSLMAFAQLAPPATKKPQLF